MNARIGSWTAAGLLALQGCAQMPNGPLPVNSSVTAQSAGVPGAVNLITNGSFEKPKVPSGSYTTFSTGQSFTGWTVVGASGNVAIISDTFVYGGYACPAGCGHQWLDLTGSSNSATGVEQKIAVVKGTTYKLSFKVGNAWAASGGIGQSSTVLVYLNDKKIYKATNKRGKGLMREVWKRFSTTFIAQGSSAKITFINGDPPSDTDNGLDCVSLSAV